MHPIDLGLGIEKSRYSQEKEHDLDGYLFKK